MADRNDDGQKHAWLLPERASQGSLLAEPLAGGASLAPAATPPPQSAPAYRRSKGERSVKVYTASHESRHLCVRNVPEIGVVPELVKQFALYGVVSEYHVLDDDQGAPEFSDTVLLSFASIADARAAKIKRNRKPFFGNILHVTYAPQHESYADTADKLRDRLATLRRFFERRSSRGARAQPSAAAAPARAPASPCAAGPSVGAVLPEAPARGSVRAALLAAPLAAAEPVAPPAAAAGAAPAGPDASSGPAIAAPSLRKRRRI